MPAVLDARDALAAAYPATPPGHNTPTALALAQVLQGLPAAAAASGPQHVVLATDGRPYQCFDSVTLEPPAVDYAAVVTVAQQAAAAGVTVHVLSLAPADGEFAVHLDQVALAGGTTAALLPADGAELVAQLEGVVAAAISCEVQLDGRVTAGVRCGGSVVLSGDPLACEGSDGYRIVGEDRLELLGSACERFKLDPDATLAVTFPCEAFTPG
jgi:hypothetical protein